MTFWQKKRVFAILLIAFVVLLFISSDFVGKWLYPIDYKQEIMQNAAKYSIDPFLIAAIIRVESSFVPNLHSRKGAFGLMQLMPETAGWIIEKAELSPGWIHELDKPHVNIEVGTWYISWLHKQFEGNPYAALAGYNAGQGNANKWLSSGVWDGSLKNIETIPFGETRHYIQRVNYYYNKYRKLYEGQWPEASTIERSIGLQSL
jgi:soluble lytic murein transglycosylase